MALEQNGWNFTDDILKRVSLKDNLVYFDKGYSMSFNGSEVSILVRIVFWRQAGDKSLAESMMTCVDEAILRYQPPIRVSIPNIRAQDKVGIYNLRCNICRHLS